MSLRTEKMRREAFTPMEDQGRNLGIGHELCTKPRRVFNTTTWTLDMARIINIWRMCII